jgi:hypothetical protein
VGQAVLVVVVMVDLLTLHHPLREQPILAVVVVVAVQVGVMAVTAVQAS